MSVITGKTIESNENVHYFAMKRVELYVVRMGILDIAAGFDEKFRKYTNVVFIIKMSRSILSGLFKPLAFHSI